MTSEPTTLQEAILYFSDPNNCIDYLAVRRWPKGVICPGCGSERVSFNAKRRTWKCSKHHAKREFSVKVGTIFEDSPIGLDKWLAAAWMLTNCKNGISSYEIARDLKVTQKTAWFMMHRIRLAMQDDSFGQKLGGPGSEIEVDETFIGGKARFMHRDKYLRRIKFAGNTGDKTIVWGVLDRAAKQVRTQVIENRRREVVHPLIREHVSAGSALFTDEMGGYRHLTPDFTHQVVDHTVKYVHGRVHTNGLENFWSLLKRGLHGTYVAVEPFHLFRYLDEQMFRYNNRSTKDRKVSDADRFNMAISKIIGKRLTFAELTGKVGSAEAF